MKKLFIALLMLGFLSSYSFAAEQATVAATDATKVADKAEKKEMKKAKMWVWEGDPIAQAAYKAIGVTPRPLSVVDVMSSLERSSARPATETLDRVKDLQQNHG